MHQQSPLSLIIKDIPDRLLVWFVQGATPSDIVNVTWSNIIIETEYHAPRWWGNGDWLGITMLPR